MSDLAEQHQLFLERHLKAKAHAIKEQLDLKLIPNPVVRIYGFGPKGQKCKGCKKLYFRQHSKRYYKCELRKETRGTGSDHRVNWPACSKFERASA